MCPFTFKLFLIIYFMKILDPLAGIKGLRFYDSLQFMQLSGEFGLEESISKGVLFPSLYNHYGGWDRILFLASVIALGSIYCHAKNLDCFFWHLLACWLTIFCWIFFLRFLPSPIVHNLFFQIIYLFICFKSSL